MSEIPGISAAPVFATDRSPLSRRVRYDFRDYGFELSPGLMELFDVIPTQLSDEQCFLFLLSRDDVSNGRWSLYNLHVFLKRTGSIQDFAHSLGASVQNIELTPTTAFRRPAVGYSRSITMGELFKGAESVITLIGGEPNRSVRDSHFYFMHQHAHCYTGMLHIPGEERKYETLRDVMFDLVTFLD